MILLSVLHTPGKLLLLYNVILVLTQTIYPSWSFFPLLTAILC